MSIVGLIVRPAYLQPRPLSLQVDGSEGVGWHIPFVVIQPFWLVEEHDVRPHDEEGHRQETLQGVLAVGDCRHQAGQHPVAHHAEDNRVIELGRAELLAPGGLSLSNGVELQVDRSQQRTEKGQPVPPCRRVPTTRVGVGMHDRSTEGQERRDDDGVVDDEGPELDSPPLRTVDAVLKIHQAVDEAVVDGIDDEEDDESREGPQSTQIRQCAVLVSE